MKLIDFLSEIEVDEWNLRDALSDIQDGMVAAGLRDYRNRRISDYEHIASGHSVNIYVYGNPDADAKEIRKRIEAIDLILSEYTSDHVAYDFDLLDESDKDYEDGSN